MRISTESGNYDVSPQALVDYSTSQLLEIHNAFADTSLKSWKQSKAKLIQRITEVGNLVSVKHVPGKPNHFEAEVDQPASEPKAKKSKKNKAKAPKAKAPRKAPKSYLMLGLIAEASERGVCVSAEFLADMCSTSKGSIASYISYFRKGIKGHDRIDIKNNREEGGFYIETLDECMNAYAAIEARSPKEEAA